MTERAKSIVVNSPYSEPERYIDTEHEEGFMIQEGRRPAGFYVESRKKGTREFVELELVNQIRPRVKAWRESGYPEITGVTRELLEHWRDRSARPNRPLFWCQVEAAETLIYLAETKAGRIFSEMIPNDGGEFRRVCTKLCTGGGKTVVMSMLVAWQVCNAVSYPRMKEYAKNFLVVAPNLTVKDRLQVLMPQNENNYYDSFCIVPDGMRGMLNHARVVVVNWQAMQESKPDEKCVVKLPKQSGESFCREVVGEMRNILVINDEAHHAYRLRAGDAKAKTREEKAEVEEATVWMKGLDRIHSVRGIRKCYDFSATPFVPGREKDEDRGLFGWIVSDYSLDDGIEAGIVKTPRIPIHDNTPVDKDTGKSKLYHIYKYVKDNLNSKTESFLPDLVRQAYMLLGHEWLETFRQWQKEERRVPPVMISVANTTNTAARIENSFVDDGLSDVPELRDKEHILRIDSVILAEKSDAESEALRKKVATTGQAGQPGGELRNIISVGMLSEGWDARNVTHIMGLRAFTSQLLCEQIVGRGLRRTSYEAVGDGELFPQEYVSVFGVPFAYLLTEEHRPSDEPRTPKTLREVRVLDDRKEYALTWPEVNGIEYVIRQKLTLRLEDVPALTLNAENVPINAEMSPVLNGKTNPMMIDDIDLENFYSQRRMQSIIFETAANVYDDMRAAISPNNDTTQPINSDTTHPTTNDTTQTINNGVTHPNTDFLHDANKVNLIGQIVKLTEDYIHSGKITIAPELFETDIRRRKILLCLNMDRVIRNMWQGIRSSNYEDLIPMFPQGRRERSTGDMPKWWTSREVYETRKSQINLCVCDSGYEDSAGYALDRNINVSAWAKNDHLGFSVKYVYGGVTRKYLPDFLVRLVNGKMLILEMKGIETEQDKAKFAALCEWVRAVNSHKEYGRWECVMCTSPAEIDGVIAEYLD